MSVASIAASWLLLAPRFDEPYLVCAQRLGDEPQRFARSAHLVLCENPAQGGSSENPPIDLSEKAFVPGIPDLSDGVGCPKVVPVLRQNLIVQPRRLILRTLARQDNACWQSLSYCSDRSG